MNRSRPKVRITFRFNLETGEVEEFRVDDQAPGANERYHDDIARAVASRMSRNPEILEAPPNPTVESPIRTPELPETRKDPKTNVEDR